MTIKRLLIVFSVAIVTAAISFAIVLSLMVNSEWVKTEAESNRLTSQLLAEELRVSTIRLTSAIRHFAITADERYAEEYMSIRGILNGEAPRPADSAIAPGQMIPIYELLSLANFTETELELLRLSSLASAELQKIEMEAMNAARGRFPDGAGGYSVTGEPDMELALSLVISREYEARSEDVMQPITQLYQEMTARLESNTIATQASFERYMNMQWAFLFLLLGLFTVFVIWVRISVIRPILLSDSFARQITAGNLNSSLDYESGNEIGSLASSLRSMLQSLLERLRLQEHSNRFSAIVSTEGVGIIIKDREGYVVDWNIGAQMILGYAPEEILGHTARAYRSKMQAGKVASINQQLLAGKSFSIMDDYLIHKDGRIIYCYTSFSPISDANGTVTGSVVVFYDSTAIQQAEKKAKNTAALVAIADAGIIVKDQYGIVQEWNIGAENILGYKPEEVIGKSTKHYAPEEIYADIDAMEERLKRGEHITHQEVVRKHKDGHLVDCAASYTPIMNADGSLANSVAIFHDISDKKLMEKELKNAVIAAEEASEAKSAFLAKMSHEIRTPMNGIIGFAELAAADNNIPLKTRNYLENIRESADGLLSIINDILDLSKIESGKMNLEKIPFSIQSVLNECRSICHPWALEKGLDLFFYAAPLQAKKLLGDPTKLRQILLNLLSNAIKFTDVGGVKLMVSVLDEYGDIVMLRFLVKDSGIGMSPEQTQNIFEPFIQGDSSTTRKYGGTGIGLSIAKSMIELMGGDLSVESVPGAGSVFFFNIPFATIGAEIPDLENPGPQMHDQQEKPIFRGCVLICEDNITNQLIIRDHLSRVGLDSVIAENGRLGVEMVKARMAEGNPFDLIFMDIFMPEMDGLEAAQELKEIGNETPIVALTANIMQNDVETYQAHGMPVYLGKPFKARELWACLLKFLTPVETIIINEPGKQTENEMDEQQSEDTVINRSIGMRQVDNDAALYERLLMNFAAENKNILNKFSAALAAGDIKLAHRIAHTLKGSSGQIGANQLSKAAFAVEKSLAREGNLPDELLIRLENTLSATLSALLPLLPDEHDDAVQASGKLNRDLALSLISRLEPLLESGDSTCLDHIPELAQVFAPLGASGRLIAEQIDNYEFEQALITLREIKRGIF